MINPLDLNNEDINERYRSLWGTAVGNFKSDVEASLLSIEMNRRLLEKNSEENTKLAEENHILTIENHKLSRRSIYVSFFALFIALTSAVFSFIDWKEDEKWQFEQITKLSLIVDKSVESNSLLTKQLSLNDTHIELEREKLLIINNHIKELNKLKQFKNSEK